MLTMDISQRNGKPRRCSASAKPHVERSSKIVNFAELTKPWFCRPPEFRNSGCSAELCSARFPSLDVRSA